MAARPFRPEQEALLQGGFVSAKKAQDQLDDWRHLIVELGLAGQYGVYVGNRHGMGWCILAGRHDDQPLTVVLDAPPIGAAVMRYLRARPV